MRFLAVFFGQKMRIFFMASLKHLATCSKTLQTTFFGVEHPQNRVWGPTTDHPGPKKHFFWPKKMAFFRHLFGENAVFFVLAAPKHFITCFNTLRNMFLKREHKSNLYHLACVHWGCILSFHVCTETKLTSGNSNRQQTTDSRQQTMDEDVLQTAGNKQDNRHQTKHNG